MNPDLEWFMLSDLASPLDHPEHPRTTRALVEDETRVEAVRRSSLELRTPGCAPRHSLGSLMKQLAYTASGLNCQETDCICQVV